MGIIRIKEQKIKRLYFKILTKEEKEQIFDIKNGPNAGKKIAMFAEKTHKLTMQMDDDTWYYVTHIKIRDNSPLVWRKEVDKEWITINEGAIISFKAQENGKFNANVLLDSVDVIENGPENKNPYIYNPSEEKKEQMKENFIKNKDQTGMMVGHSIKGACKAVGEFNIGKIVEMSKEIYLLTQELKNEFKDVFPGMSEYDVGMTVGNTILCVCGYGGSVSTIKERAKTILNNVVNPVTKFIKEGGKKTTKEKPIENNNIPEIIDDEEFPF